MKGYQFAHAIHSHWRKTGKAGKDIIFRTEDGDYVPLEVEEDSEGRTVVLLLEEGK